ncbi:hypothetical protein EP18_03795 [Lysinibacillus sphaericus]|nr:helix-turn-helix transcriptional regulator [Lysinibacillus sphaericus]KEK12997.1 hypothetical protein EP18_03795 [Lysinibacillus sphaericus]
MIKCNLAVLLAERGLKMADVISDTSLSKTAVRGLFYNESKGIQYETLEILCDYLNVGPEDIIKKIHFSDELLEKDIDDKTGTIDYRILFKFDIKEFVYTVRVNLNNLDYINDELATTLSSYELYVNFTFEKEFKQNIFSQITFFERQKFENKLLDDYLATLHLQNHLLREVHYIDVLTLKKK